MKQPSDTALAAQAGRETIDAHLNGYVYKIRPTECGIANGIIDRGDSDTFEVLQAWTDAAHAFSDDVREVAYDRMEKWLAGGITDHEMSARAIEKMNCERYTLTRYERHSEDVWSATVATRVEALELVYDWRRRYTLIEEAPPGGFNVTVDRTNDWLRI
jgi:hypothetical protein